MTQEDKSLLLKDLCERLPYGVMIEGLEHPEVMTIKHLAIISAMPAELYKPYLRQMSSMTNEEKEELVDFGLAYWSNGKHTDEDGNTIVYGERNFNYFQILKLMIG